MKHWNKLTTSIKAFALTPIVLGVFAVIIHSISWLFKNGYFETVLIAVACTLAVLVSYCIIYCLLDD